MTAVVRAWVLPTRPDQKLAPICCCTVPECGSAQIVFQRDNHCLVKGRSLLVFAAGLRHAHHSWCQPLRACIPAVHRDTLCLNARSALHAPSRHPRGGEGVGLTAPGFSAGRADNTPLAECILQYVDSLVPACLAMFSASSCGRPTGPHLFGYSRWLAFLVAAIPALFLQLHLRLGTWLHCWFLPLCAGLAGAGAGVRVVCLISLRCTSPQCVSQGCSCGHAHTPCVKVLIH